ncbi:MAG: YibE/F family protein [[Lactobacillus] timonensis]|nr:YibE/F family protein [[Lactobacillus] timonensis]
MSSISLLSLVLLVIMVVVGRQQGWLAFVSIWLNFLSLFLFITLIVWHFPPLLLTVIFSVLILTITIFLGDDQTSATIPAFVAALLVTAITMISVVITVHFALTYGFSIEDSDDLQGMSTMIGINYIHISVATTTLCSLGAVAEAAIAISSGIDEVAAKHSALSFQRLFAAGMHIGHQIIGTTINTLFFGFFGGLLSLFTWFASLHYSWAMIFNNQIMVGELVEILISFLGVLLTVPITAWIACFYHQRSSASTH